jgi:hypothetical protein
MELNLAECAPSSSAESTGAGACSFPLATRPTASESRRSGFVKLCASAYDAIGLEFRTLQQHRHLRPHHLAPARGHGFQPILDLPMQDRPPVKPAPGEQDGEEHGDRETHEQRELARDGDARPGKNRDSECRRRTPKHTRVSGCPFRFPF